MNESNKFIQSAFKKKINLEIRNGKQSDGFSGILFSTISAALLVLSPASGGIEGPVLSLSKGLS